ncbi:P-loop containing nucleoside triphosphate hydrolase protein [Exophiala viscosa]|uniref:P-loop containing nucleoside triphosphate hydrolase protein n=1 Tax=Exophiala viscosa TaxID=2486360 RepID=UPI0021A18776|nr:P-loop containing nucleoside triphosphate hydrolase protein [Exophiala viscosa]
MGNTNNVHWGVDRPVNNMFTGREDILEDLEQKLREAARAGMNDKQPRIVISGMGGLGKSEICLQLAQRLRSLFWGVFWIDVSTPSLAQNGFLGIADRLKISATTWEDGRRGLANVHQRWLLVLDNADDPDLDYQTYFPPSSYGVVILTSRNADCEQYATADFIALTQLARGDAQHLVFKAARVPDGERSAVENDARAVAALLNSHPLALIQAGAYVAHGHCTLARYPEVFTRFRKRLLAFRPLQVQSRYGDVYACFQASIQILQSSATASAQDALQLLPLLSMYGTREIPLQLFEAAWNGGRKFLALGDSLDSHDLALTSWHVSRLPAFIDPDNNSWDPFRLIEAVHTLRSLALVSATAQGEQMRVSMHPLLHAWARDCQDEQQQHTSWVSASCIIAISSSDREFWRSQARLLQPHLQVLLDCDMRCIYGSDRSVSITEILIECGWTLEMLRDDNSLLRLTDRLCAHHQLSRVVVKEEWLSLYQLRGSALLHHGKFKDSIVVLEQIAKIRERLVDDHPDRVKSQHDLARAYVSNGQVNQAITLLEHLNRIQEKLAEDHPNRLASQHELAAAYRVKGQIVEAIKILEDVVRIESEDLPKNQPNRLASQHELACAYVAIGQISEAIPRLEYVAQIKEELTEDHPSRLVTQHELAYAYLKNARVEEAIVLLEHVVRMQESLAEDHPLRPASQGLLACAYQESGQVEKAARLLTAGTRPRERLEKDKKSTHVGFTQRNPDSSPAVDPSMCSPSHNASESLVSQVVNLQSTSDLTHHQVLRRTNR